MAPAPSVKASADPDAAAKLKREPFAHPNPNQPVHKNGGGVAHSG